MLVVIDTQVDFVDGGAWSIPGTTQILPNGDDVDLLRRAAIAAGAPIARPGSVGSQIAPELRLLDAPDLDVPTLIAGHVQHLGPHEVAVWKPRWSAFYRTGLDQHLATLGVHTIVFAEFLNRCHSRESGPRLIPELGLLLHRRQIHVQHFPEVTGDVLEALPVHEAFLVGETPGLSTGREGLVDQLVDPLPAVDFQRQDHLGAFVASTMSLFVNDLKNGSTSSMA